jgi:hypothetical protein
MTPNEELLVVQLAGEDPRDSLVLATAAAFCGLGCNGEPLDKPEAIQDLEDRNGELDEDHPLTQWTSNRWSVRQLAIEAGLNWESTNKAIQRLRQRNLLARDGQVSADDLRARNWTKGRIWLNYSRELRTYGMPYRAKAVVAWLLNRKAQFLGPQTTAWCKPQLARIMGWTERQVDVALTKAKVEGWIQRRRVGNRWHTTAGRFTLGEG